MKTTIPKQTAIAVACLLFSHAASAASYSQAEFTRVDNDVKVLKESHAPASASLGLQIKAVTSVVTGANSRAEMRFPDKSLTRLGANSRFTLRGEGRTLDLNKGTLLLQVPKRQGGATIRTAAVTAAITGTTVLMEYEPDGIIKFMVIEGEATLSLTGDPSVFQVVKAGQIITMREGQRPIPRPDEFDIVRLLNTSKLISNNEAGTPNQQEVANAVKAQLRLVENGELMHGGLVLPGGLTLDGATNLNGQTHTLTNLQKQVVETVREVVRHRPPPHRQFTPPPQFTQPAPVVTTTPPPVTTTPTTTTAPPPITIGTGPGSGL